MISEYGKSQLDRSALGYASISFRKTTNPANPDELYTGYICNSHGDGWFRKEKSNSITSGYGLAINDVKVTSRKPIAIGKNFLAYKAKIEYINNEEQVETDMFWIYVHNSHTIEDVLNYIEDHQEEWYP
jgi:hypothetical protein